MSAEPIYLDHNSTTPIDPRVVEAMARAWRDCGANPASQHAPGRQARRMLEEAREGIARTARRENRRHGRRPAHLHQRRHRGEQPGASLAFAGTKPGPGSRSRHRRRSNIPASWVAVRELGRRGWQVEVLRPQENGYVDGRTLFSLMFPAADRRGLASLMLANNETGVIQPVAAFAAHCEGTRIVFHTDAVQAVGKIARELPRYSVAAMTVAPHKFHGPLGIGALLLATASSCSRTSSAAFNKRPASRNRKRRPGRRLSRSRCACAHVEADERESRMAALRDELEQIDSARNSPTSVIIGERASATAQHVLRLLSRPRSPGAGDGPGPGRRGLLDRFGLCQRVVGTVADAGRDGPAERR